VAENRMTETPQQPALNYFLLTRTVPRPLSFPALAWASSLRHVLPHCQSNYHPALQSSFVLKCLPCLTQVPRVNIIFLELSTMPESIRHAIAVC
jgi:hypothetical protein